MFFINEGGYLVEELVKGRESPVSGKGRTYVEGGGMFKEDEAESVSTQPGGPLDTCLCSSLCSFCAKWLNGYPQITRRRGKEENNTKQQINELKNHK